MTLRQKIAELEKEVAELKMKVILLEARPMVITVPLLPATPTPYQPGVIPIPMWPNPYIGDYPLCTNLTCDSTSVMSAQRSQAVQ